MPSTNRPGYASARARLPFAMATESRAQMLAIPVATTSDRLKDNSSAECANASLLPRPSGIQSARYPSCSTWATNSRALGACCRSKANVHTPTRPMEATVGFSVAAIDDLLWIGLRERCWLHEPVLGRHDEVGGVGAEGGSFR